MLCDGVSCGVADDGAVMPSIDLTEKTAFGELSFFVFSLAKGAGFCYTEWEYTNDREA